MALSLSSAPLLAQESIDFHAEHILEVPMDFAYLALPQKPARGEKEEWRFGYSYADTASGGIKATVPMLTLHYYSEFKDDSGIEDRTGFKNSSGFSIGAFYQKYNFEARPRTIIVSPSFANLTAYPQTFNANLTHVSGNADHFGMSLGYYFDFDSGASLQLGAVLEKLKVNQFKADFVSLNFAIDFLGSIDYSGDYNSFTPYAMVQFSPDPFGDWIGSLKVILTQPFPRVGFIGSFSTSSYQVSGNSSAIGNGEHIPDSYLGVSYTLENSSGFRVDLGALVYSYIFEPYGHTGFDSPIYLSFSNSF